MAEKQHSCETCTFRKKAEEKPSSFLAWIWRLHTRICPGWKSYQKHLREQGKTGS